MPTDFQSLLRSDAAFTAATALAFAAVAFATRMVLLHTQSRFQVSFFIATVAAFEWMLRPQMGRRASLPDFLIVAVFAVAGVVIARWHVEGLPSWKHLVSILPKGIVRRLLQE